MKKVNIQRDLRSRAEISERIDYSLNDMISNETAFSSVSETLNEPDNAESEVIQEPENDESPSVEETPKKRGRKAKGDPQEV